MSGVHDTVALRRGAARLAISPELGGTILGYWTDRDGTRLDWLTPRGSTPIAGFESTGIASFPLVPYSNRIRNGRFAFRGRTVTQPLRPGTDFAIHGHGRGRAWQVVEARDDALTLAYEHAPDAWPWRYRAEQRFALTDDTLTLTLTVENRAAEDMPAGLGHHPYFPRTPGTRVSAAVASMWQPEAGLFPTSHAPPPPEADPNRGIDVDRVALDHAYAGWTGRVTVDWPERGARLTMTADPAPATLIVYAPAEKDFVCVEPVSHCVDAFNLAAAGMTDTGIRVLAPGESCRLVVTLQPEFT